MDIGTAILIIGFAALVAAFLLLVIGLVYSELMNSDIPHGVANSGKLHMVHGLFVGIAIVVSTAATLELFLFLLFFSRVCFLPVQLCFNLYIVLLNASLVLETKAFKWELYLESLRKLSFLRPRATDKAQIREVLDKKSSLTKVQRKARLCVVLFDVVTPNMVLQREQPLL